MTKIFISYRRDDSADVTGRIFEYLTEISKKFDRSAVFMDVDGIPLGVNVPRYIDERVSQCAVMLVVIGAQWVTIIGDDGERRLHHTRDYVRIEVETAIRRGIPIIPVLVMNAKMPRETDLPDSIRDLLDYNGLPVRRDPDFRNDMARLITALDTIVNGVPPTPPPVQTPPPPPKPRSKVYAILPAPFAWIDISAGKVTLEAGGYVPEGGQTFDVPAFSIAKYPVTNAQYRVFVDKANGYMQRQWWTDAGWALRESEKWTQPRYWTDNQWNKDEQPVVGVSWYESVAFCRWLSEAAGEQIMLPTDQQWQRAAQGDDGRVYPWGDTWDASRCNTKESNISKTTPVRQYEGKDKGDSPFGVTDMVGNVWEWCLTDSHDNTNDINTKSEYRVLRGRSWDSARSNARAAYRYYNYPNGRNFSYGFRVCCRPLLISFVL